MKLVHDFLEKHARAAPEKVALIHGDQQLTYCQIDTKANQLAHAFVQQGVQRGDRIILWLPNSVDLVIAIYAAMKANAVFVPIHASTKQQKMAFLLNDSGARALVTTLRHAGTAAALQEICPALSAIFLSGSGELPDNRSGVLLNAIYATNLNTPPTRQLIDQDLACLIYTSGSTGEPKGVMSAHSNVVFAASSIIQYLGNRPDDIIINGLPLSFDYGLYQCLMAFQFGGTLVLEKSLAYPSQLLRHMQEHRVTVLPLVPTLAAILVPMDLSGYDLSALRLITNTAAALPPSHILALQEKFPGTTLFSMYGLTETKRTLYLPPEQLAHRPDSVGIPIPGTEVWLEDETGARLEPGNTGELVIRGRHVMRGYWRRPEATAARYRPGPLPNERVCYSGDLFRMDEEGYFYFVGRKDDIIKSGGEKVAPKEIETVLYGIEGVTETAVIGTPDPLLGEAIKAFIVATSPLDEKSVLRHCRAHLESFMVPHQIEFRKTLPKTSSGKIKKTGLS